jgi:predicted N-acetyltransferase YhbS
VENWGVQLTTIATADYARDVLPHSSAIWSNGRSFDEYVEDFVAVAAGAYGKRHFRTLGLRLDGSIVVSCKRYERELRCGDRMMRAAGIGALFTPTALRGRGYASAMIGALLDSERAAGTDVAYLFSDIHPAFYERLGFVALPARTISLRAEMLPPTRLEITMVGDDDWSAIRRGFEALDSRRPIALKRTPLVWEWLRTTARASRNKSDRVALIAHRSRTASAYVFGQRLPKLDAFVMDEFGYTGDDGFDAVAPLIRSAAGDLRKVTGWLPPDIARPALPRGAVKKRKNGMTMIALLSQPARAAWRRHAAAILADDADRCWSTDHI